ncbi:MAG: hypothetical protein LBS24_08530 [Clostridiales Family XIII bacterium]|jgi:hypothetical protein|nr:hypothetical protein [Clostridiales Family XIII bacterium]
MRTVSPVAVAVLVSAAVSVYVGSFHATFDLAAVCSLLVGAALPYFVSLFGSDVAEKRRRSAERKESAAARRVFAPLGEAPGAEEIQSDGMPGIAEAELGDPRSREAASRADKGKGADFAEKEC